jgi:outer membrane protein TolC
MSSVCNKYKQQRSALMRTLRTAMVTALVGAFPALAYADEPPLTLKLERELSLTLELAQHLAVYRSTRLWAKDYAAAGYREMAVAAGQLPDPTLRIGMENFPVARQRSNMQQSSMATHAHGSGAATPTSVGSDHEPMKERRIGVMQELTSPEKRRLRALRYEREADKAIAERTATTAAILRDTALAWLDRYYFERMAALVAEQATQAASEIAAAEAAHRAGAATQADVLVARSVLSTIEDRADEIRRRASNARALLTRWVGDGADSRMGAKPDMDAISLDSAAGTFEEQLARHPQIAVLASQEQVAAAEAKLARANRNVDWSVDLAYQNRGDGHNMISFGVSIPIQWDRKHQQDRELSSKLAMLQSARAEHADTLRAYIAEVRSISNEWTSNRERRARYASDLIPLAQSRVQAVVAAFRGGRGSLADVLAARRNEVDVRLQALELEASTARLWAQLNYLAAPQTPAAQLVANTAQANE